MITPNTVDCDDHEPAFGDRQWRHVRAWRTMALSAMPRIMRLDLAQVELPEDHPAAVLGRWVAVHGFLIEHPAGVVLVDTGVGFDNPLIDDLYRPDRVALGGLLAQLGVELDQVIAVINSHLHFDHCGQNPVLFGTETHFFAQESELESVGADLTYTDPSWALAPLGQRRTVRGDEEVVDGVVVLATPGHTAGHQSVLIEGGGRRVVIGGQVVWHHDEFEAEVASPANVDPVRGLQVAAVESIRRLKALDPEVVHFSHCPPHHPPPSQRTK